MKYSPKQLEIPWDQLFPPSQIYTRHTKEPKRNSKENKSQNSKRTFGSQPAWP